MSSIINSGCSRTITIRATRLEKSKQLFRLLPCGVAFVILRRIMLACWLMWMCLGGCKYFSREGREGGADTG